VDVVPGQAYYPVTNSDIFIADLFTLQTVKFVPTGEQGWPLIVKADETIENTNPGAATERSPMYYAYAQMQLRLFPVPVRTGKCTIIATYMYPKFTSDEDSNVFLERSDELIRQAAKRYIAYNTLHDQALGDRCAGLEAEEYASLLAENRAREPVEPMQVHSDLVALSYGSNMYDVRNDT
jgi:hypothetical protein